MKHRFSDYPRHPQVRQGQPWIMRVPLVSTCHITREDDAHLLAQGEAGPALFPPSLEGSGHLLFLGEADEPWADDPALSPALNRLCRDLQAKGWGYLRLSRDGEEFTDLPTFEW